MYDWLGLALLLYDWLGLALLVYDHQTCITKQCKRVLTEPQNLEQLILQSDGR